MKNILKISLLFTGIIFYSCNDYLDTLPDNRTTMDSEDKVEQLLVSAYPNCLNVMMYEYYGDNWDKHDWNLNFNNYQDQLWNWKDQLDRQGNDHAFRSWELTYGAIAACNESLKAIEEMGNPPSLKAAQAEALIARAWNHFEMATLFCLPYGTNSASDPGLPYMTQPEVTVRPNYQRGTVKEFFDKIRDDIEAALPHIDNSIYTQPKCHFNVSAANAFAVKFYMTVGEFDKAIECANRVLSSDPRQVIRNWQITTTMDMNTTEMNNTYLSKDNPATLLVSYPISGWSTNGPLNYSTGNKFSHSMLVGKYETLQSNGPWGAYSQFYIRTWWNQSTNKLFHRKIGYYFEYTDPVARTGYQHTGYAHFTTDEVLLYRAEAYIHKKEYQKALDDLNIFITNYSRCAPLTIDAVLAFYRDMPYYIPAEIFDDKDNLLQAPTPKKELKPPLYTIEYGADQEWMLHYVLHLRRILLMGEGQRWLDIKRYGITVYRRLVDNRHHVIGEPLDVMRPDDKRRAIQIPKEIIDAGCPANER